MADREKVIRGLECHATKGFVACQDCPYYPDELIYEDDDDMEGTICEEKLAADALALLREQEPRVVTTADFENNPNLDDGGHLNVWEEYKDGTRYRWNTINVNDVRAFTDIHRYWTSRPTPEQMRAVPWN